MRSSIGRVGRPHGIDGSFVVERASDDARWWKAVRGSLRPAGAVEVVGVRRASGRPVIRLDQGVERGTTFEVEREELPPTDDDEYYTFQLVGLEVVEENGRVLGTRGGRAPRGRERRTRLDGGILLPMIEDCVRDVDLDGGRIVVADGFAN